MATANCTQGQSIDTGAGIWTSQNIDYSWHFFKDTTAVSGFWGDLSEPNPLWWSDGVLYAIRKEDHAWYKVVGTNTSQWVKVGAKPACGGSTPPPDPTPIPPDSLNYDVTFTAPDGTKYRATGVASKV